MNELQDLLDFATDAAWQAGRITLGHYQTRIDVETKADDTSVTIADKQAELKLRELIKARYPDDGIIGEEHGEEEGTSGRRWIIDPIDGTISFMAGRPIFGTLIVGGIGAAAALMLGDQFLPESNAACFYLADGSALIPTDRFARADMLRWMFWEQYNHEPNIATLRFWHGWIGEANLTDLQRATLPGPRSSETASR